MTRIAEASPKSAIISTSAYSGDQGGSIQRSGHHAGHLSKAVAPSRLGEEILSLLELKDLDARRGRVATAQLPPEPRSAGKARQFVGETLDEWGCEDMVDTVKLLVSELTSNAISHARSEVDISVELFAGRLRVEVADAADEGLRRREPDEFDMSGRGISMVETTADAWGVRSRSSGKAVWFELTRRPDGEG